MNTKYDIYKIILISHLFFLLIAIDIYPQDVYDTLYLHPDTTIFYNQTVIVVDDISNLAMKFNVNSNWTSYQIEKILVVIPNNLDTAAFEYYQISVGEVPLDSIIYTKQVFNYPSFPSAQEILIDPPIILERYNCFYISGVFNVSVSDFVIGGIPGIYAYWWPIQTWIDYFPVYFNVKVIVKRRMTMIEGENLSRKDFILFQNHPNPFNFQTKIAYNSEESGKAEIEIFNILGNKVYSLTNQEVYNGVNEFTINGEYLTSGVYFYRLFINNKYISIKKMIVLK